jgi:hypothetical protein
MCRPTLAPAPQAYEHFDRGPYSQTRVYGLARGLQGQGGFVKRYTAVACHHSGFELASPTTVEGAVRLITLTKMIGGDELMRGAVLTQIDRDAHYLPSFSPIVLTKLRNYEPETHRAMTGDGWLG